MRWSTDKGLHGAGRLRGLEHLDVEEARYHVMGSGAKKPMVRGRTVEGRLIYSATRDKQEEGGLLVTLRAQGGGG